MMEGRLGASDTGGYVPREASEAAIAELMRALGGRQTRLVLLYGPPGIGKSALLGEVTRRIKSPDLCLRMDHQEQSAGALCTWLARELEADATRSGREESWSRRVKGLWSRGGSRRDPAHEELLAQVEACRQSGARVVALIDEADEIDAESVRELAEVSRAAGGDLRMAIATSSSSLSAEVSDCAEVVHYQRPLSEPETQAYVDAYLERAGIPGGMRGALDADRLRRLHHFSEGNPRRLQAELSLICIELGARLGSESFTPVRPDPTPVRASPEPAPAPDVASVGDPAKAVDPPAGAAVVQAAAPLDSAPRPPRWIEVDPPPIPRGWKLLGWVGLAAIGACTAWLVSALLSPDAAPEAYPSYASADTPAASRPPAVSAGPARSAGIASEVSVNINAEPWAAISIDGELVGETPLGDVPLTPGTHLFRADFADGRIQERTVDISASERWIYFESAAQ